MEHNYFHFNWLGRKINIENVIKNLDKVQGVVYDLGCGTKPYKHLIEKVSKEYIGVDWQNTLHTHAMDIISDLNQELPIASNIADTVVSFQVLEHLSEPQKFLCEANRILKPGGNIILTVPFQWWIHEAPYDYNRFTKYGLEHIFKKAGFVDMKIIPTTGFWTTWFLKFNYHTLRYIRGPRVIRSLIKGVLSVVWCVNQIAASVLDKYNNNPLKTAGYIVTAKK